MLSVDQEVPLEWKQSEQSVRIAFHVRMFAETIQDFAFNRREFQGGDS